jgi:hypothetical protein
MNIPMALSARAPRRTFSRPRANPTLETIEYIRSALQGSDGPISRNGLLEQLAKWGHSTSRQSLNAALSFLAADGNIVEGSKGILWVPPASPQLREILLTGERL